MCICLLWFLVVLWILHGVPLIILNDVLELTRSIDLYISYAGFFCSFFHLLFLQNMKLLCGISNHVVPFWFFYNPILELSCCILTFLKFLLNVCRKLMNYVMNGFHNPLFLLLMKSCTMNHQCWRGNYIFPAAITLEILEFIASF